MKPIIIDMNEMTDSTEVYGSKPHPVVFWFLHVIMIFVVLAVIWMCIFRVDIEVKGVGTIAVAADISTVSNQLPGLIAVKNVQDGQRVEKGDILYAIEHQDYDLQLEAYTKQAEDNEERIAMLEAYDAWLEDDVSIGEEYQNNIYYSDIASRMLLVKNNEESLYQNYHDELSTYATKIETSGSMEEYYQSEIDWNRRLKEALSKHENPFSKNETYYYSRMENYIAQYNNTAGQYDVKINELRRQKEELQKTVSDGDATSGAVEDLEKSINDMLFQRDSALKAYETQSIEAVEQTILNLEQNIKLSQNNKSEYMNGKTSLTKNGVNTKVMGLIATEHNAVVSELNICRQKQQDLQKQIESLSVSLENAYVKAPISGVVNMINDVSLGDYATGGMQLLSIIPDTESSAYIVKSYIANGDIAKIDEGMKVKYEISAYPSNEYGTMGGQVEFVSADLKVNESGSAYYVIESSIDSTEFCNKSGDIARLKVGMLCETKIITETKSVMNVLIEKLFGAK
ncbi:MAG: HlyD family efflux transporter periplasmic adaptor subunit [Acetatifactor sp.]|nr:HlyD family efflux transporter periplasmic adaptor subunit [Acetatifactor sp.]